MKLATEKQGVLSRLIKDRRGNFGMMTALLLPVLLGAGVVSVVTGATVTSNVPIGGAIGLKKMGEGELVLTLPRLDLVGRALDRAVAAHVGLGGLLLLGVLEEPSLVAVLLLARHGRSEAWSRHERPKAARAEACPSGQEKVAGDLRARRASIRSALQSTDEGVPTERGFRWAGRLTFPARGACAALPARAPDACERRPRTAC